MLLRDGLERALSIFVHRQLQTADMSREYPLAGPTQPHQDSLTLEPDKVYVHGATREFSACRHLGCFMFQRATWTSTALCLNWLPGAIPQVYIHTSKEGCLVRNMHGMHRASLGSGGAGIRGSLPPILAWQREGRSLAAVEDPANERED